jgi:hypothetical protein
METYIVSHICGEVVAIEEMGAIEGLPRGPVVIIEIDKMPVRPVSEGARPNI